MTRFLLFWMAAGVLGFPFLEALVGKSPLLLDLYFWPVMFFHCLAALLLFFSVPKGEGWFHVRRLMAGFFFFLVLLFPLFGWLGIAVLHFCYRSGPRIPLEEEQATQFISSHLRWMGPLQGVPRRERIMQELDFLPLADILSGTDLDLKRGAIERLARLKTPEAIDLLLAHRSDPSMDVRFYATSALARIKKEFDEQLEAAKQQMQKDVYKISARVFLSKVYLQYAHSHLLDPATIQAFEREALFHLDFCVQSQNATPQAFRMLVSIYVAHAEWDMAIKTIALWEKSGKTDPQEISKVRIDVLYRTGRYLDVFEEFVRMKERGIADSEWNTIADWWGAYR
ncbi:MAG: hypothetical protein Q7T03_08865 [Deltaproteobacteria bacterium]|nr:hypothetical protein [Deltaproteobacteria bacterium]